MSKLVEKLTLVNSLYAVVSETGKLYSVDMNWNDAIEMVEFYNRTIHDEGKFMVKEISLNDTVVIEGEFAKKGLVTIDEE